MDRLGHRFPDAGDGGQFPMLLFDDEKGILSKLIVDSAGLAVSKALDKVAGKETDDFLSAEIHFVRRAAALAGTGGDGELQAISGMCCPAASQMEHLIDDGGGDSSNSGKVLLAVQVLKLNAGPVGACVNDMEDTPPNI